MAEHMRMRIQWDSGEATTHDYIGLAGDRVAYEVDGVPSPGPTREQVCEFAASLRAARSNGTRPMRYAGLTGVLRTVGYGAEVLVRQEIPPTA